MNISINCMFMYSRPGILVLVNNADWELVVGETTTVPLSSSLSLYVIFQGKLEYEILNKDEIVFISTLHGG